MHFPNQSAMPRAGEPASLQAPASLSRESLVSAHEWARKRPCQSGQFERRLADLLQRLNLAGAATLE